MNSALIALAEPNRLNIVDLLRSGPKTVNEITSLLYLHQPQVSKHLRVLKSAGIVEVYPRAQQRIYQLQSRPFQELDQWLSNYRQIWDDRFDALEVIIEVEKIKLNKEDTNGKK